MTRVIERDLQRRMVRLVIATVVAASLLRAMHTAAEVGVEVVRVGFPIVPEGPMVRPGTWTPVIIDVSLLLNQASFDGTVRVGQPDTDGDECYDSVAIHLRAETGGYQRVVLYALANTLRNRGRFDVELRDTDGETVEVICQGERTRTARAAIRAPVLSADALLILSVSCGAVGRVVDFADSNTEELYARDIVVGHMSPIDLPELWIGLEAVDCIVWDEASAADLTDKQLAALLEWVRQGGHLLIFASRTAGSLALTPALNAVLPVDLGDVESVDDLGRVEVLVRSKEPFVLKHPVPVVQCSPREGAVRLVRDVDLVTRRSLDRGQVTFAGITQKDLFSAPGSAREFYRRVFHIPKASSLEEASPDYRTIFGSIVSAVGFTQSGGLYLFVAAIASILYVALATFGVWAFLGSRNQRQHSWSGFAVTALAVSVLTVIAVNSVHGFGVRLHQLSIVDLDAGDTYGYATTLFGLKTGSDKELDVWLPSDPYRADEPGPTQCSLRPLPAGNDLTEGGLSYADPQSYRLIPGSAVIEKVRIRATLKQFEGRWKGRTGGRMTGQITIKGLAILEGSYLVNQLGVDLTNCYLLHTIGDIDGTSGKRDQSIFAYVIGNVPNGAKVQLADACYGTRTGKELGKYRNQQRLMEHQKGWSRPFRTMLSNLTYGSGSASARVLGEEQAALMLLSTIGDYTPQAGGITQSPIMWSRDRLRQLDLRERLDDDAVYLIGFAVGPGPVRLMRREGDRPWTIIEPDADRSRTMYRIRIPVTLLPGGVVDLDGDGEEDGEKKKDLFDEMIEEVMPERRRP